ncbi:protein LDOC1-like [Dendropsophus ebraccatus]|uniref:protein LDOC1-like n=1 Tax=Dendropsophus ebraccatus TaxID=150705 RepID=UPI003832150A
MDPGEVPDIFDIARGVAQQIQQQSQQIQQLTAALQQRATVQRSPPTVSPPAPSPNLRLVLPSKYGGDLKMCRGFLTQCTMHIELLSNQFSTERSKVAFIISLLEGRARAWATPLWDRDDPVVANLQTLLVEFRCL